MCYNCEGEVDLDVIVCPFCAADLREEKPEQQRPLYNPMTSMKNLDTQQSLYPSHFTPKSPQAQEGGIAAEEPRVALPEEETKNIFGPLILLTLGAQFFLLGALMFICSHKGVMILKWDARFWFFYVFASIPLLIFGYRAVSKL